MTTPKAPAELGHVVTCNTCGTATMIRAGADVHLALKCGCCPVDHHHGQAASETGVPCRPVTVSANAIAVLALPGA